MLNCYPQLIEVPYCGPRMHFSSHQNLTSSLAFDHLFLNIHGRMLVPRTSHRNERSIRQGQGHRSFDRGPMFYAHCLLSNHEMLNSASASSSLLFSILTHLDIISLLHHPSRRQLAVNSVMFPTASVETAFRALRRTL